MILVITYTEPKIKNLAIENMAAKVVLKVLCLIRTKDKLVSRRAAQETCPGTLRVEEQRTRV